MLHWSEYFNFSFLFFSSLLFSISTHCSSPLSPHPLCFCSLLPTKPLPSANHSISHFLSLDLYLKGRTSELHPLSAISHFLSLLMKFSGVFCLQCFLTSVSLAVMAQLILNVTDPPAVLSRRLASVGRCVRRHRWAVVWLDSQCRLGSLVSMCCGGLVWFVSGSLDSIRCLCGRVCG